MDDKDLREMFGDNGKKDSQKIDNLIEMLKQMKDSGQEVEIKQINPVEMLKEVIFGMFGDKAAMKINEHFSNEAREYVKKAVKKENIEKHLKGIDITMEMKMQAVVYSFTMAFLQEQLEKGRIILKEVDDEHK